MNWMFFRSSSALPRDPMQMKWRLLISKIKWKKQKVRSTTQLRNSQMASILYLFCYKSLSKQTISSRESAKHKIEHLEDSLKVFGIQAKFLSIKPFQPLGFLDIISWQKFWVLQVYSAKMGCHMPFWRLGRAPNKVRLWASSKAGFSIWKWRAWTITWWSLRPLFAQKFYRFVKEKKTKGLR